jgi:hypothetical protein
MLFASSSLKLVNQANFVISFCHRNESVFEINSLRLRSMTRRKLIFSQKFLKLSNVNTSDF